MCDITLSVKEGVPAVLSSGTISCLLPLRRRNCIMALSLLNNIFRLLFRAMFSLMLPSSGMSVVSGVLGAMAGASAACVLLSRLRCCISSRCLRRSFAVSDTNNCSPMASISLHLFIYSLRRMSLGITAMLFTTSPIRFARRTGSLPTSSINRLVLKRIKSTQCVLRYSSTSSVE